MNKYINLKLALNKLWGLCEEDIEAEIPEAFDFSRAREDLYDLPTIEVSEDCISREWLLSNIERGEKEAGGIIDTDTDNVKNFIRAAPSVVPKDNSFKDGQKDMLMFLLEGMKNALEKARNERIEE